MIGPQATTYSPFSSLVIGMGHLMDFATLLTNRREGKEQDSEALRDDWRAVGRDLRQAIHIYERDLSEIDDGGAVASDLGQGYGRTLLLIKNENK